MAPLLSNPLTQFPIFKTSTNPPSPREVVSACQSLKNGKACGPDGIPPESLRYASIDMLSELNNLLVRIWNEEKIPSLWSNAIVVPVHKKGDRNILTNYRGISLLRMSNKVMTRIIMKRIELKRDSRTRPNQTGFLPGQGCADQIHTIRRILEHRHRYQQPTHVAFPDYSAAFDSIDRDMLCSALLANGVPPKLIRVLAALYQDSSACVRSGNRLSDHIPVTMRVRQDCVAALTLFNYDIDEISGRTLLDFPGVTISSGQTLSDLQYADDAVQLASSEDLQLAMTQVSAISTSYGLRLNSKKTATMINLGLPSPTICVDGEPVDSVPSFTYLGSKIIADGSASEEVKRRIELAAASFSRLYRPLWAKPVISLKTKCRIFLALVRVVLLYAAETWLVTQADLKKLDSFENRCLKSIWAKDCSSPKWEPGQPIVSIRVIREQLCIPETPSLVIKKRRIQ